MRMCLLLTQNYSLPTILNVIRLGSLPFLHNAVYLLKFLARVIGFSWAIVENNIKCHLTIHFDMGITSNVQSFKLYQKQEAMENFVFPDENKTKLIKCKTP